MPKSYLAFNKYFSYMQEFYQNNTIKNIKKTLAIYVIFSAIIFIFSKCTYTNSRNDIAITDVTSPSYLVSEKTIDFILEDNIDSLYTLCDQQAFTKDQLTKLRDKILPKISNCKVIRDKENIKTSVTETTSILGKTKVETFIYPIDDKSSDDTKSLEIGINDGKLISILYRIASTSKIY